MSSSNSERTALLEHFSREIMRQSTWTVIYHQAVAVRLGLNPTDLKSSAILSEVGPMTAGEMAELLGLTTGAITGVIDRLEKVGLVQRERDPDDRRRVVIVPSKDSPLMQEILPIFQNLSDASADLLTTHYSDDELKVIIDFIHRGTELMKAQTQQLRHHKNPQSAREQA